MGSPLILWCTSEIMSTRRTFLQWAIAILPFGLGDFLKAPEKAEPEEIRPEQRRPYRTVGSLIDDLGDYLTTTGHFVFAYECEDGGVGFLTHDPMGHGPDISWEIQRVYINRSLDRIARGEERLRSTNSLSGPDLADLLRIQFDSLSGLHKMAIALQSAGANRHRAFQGLSNTVS